MASGSDATLRCMTLPLFKQTPLIQKLPFPHFLHNSQSKSHRNCHVPTEHKSGANSWHLAVVARSKLDTNLDILLPV